MRQPFYIYSTLLGTEMQVVRPNINLPLQAGPLLVPHSPDRRPPRPRGPASRAAAAPRSAPEPTDGASFPRLGPARRGRGQLSGNLGIYIQEGSVEIFRTVCIAVHKPDCLNLYPHLHRLPSAAQCPGKRQMGLLSREGDDEAEEPEVHQAKQM